MDNVVFTSEKGLRAIGPIRKGQTTAQKPISIVFSERSRGGGVHGLGTLRQVPILIGGEFHRGNNQPHLRPRTAGMYGDLLFDPNHGRKVDMEKRSKNVPVNCKLDDRLYYGVGDRVAVVESVDQFVSNSLAGLNHWVNVVAIRDIQPGELLTCNYGIHYYYTTDIRTVTKEMNLPKSKRVKRALRHGICHEEVSFVPEPESRSPSPQPKRGRRLPSPPRAARALPPPQSPIRREQPVFVPPSPLKSDSEDLMRDFLPPAELPKPEPETSADLPDDVLSGLFEDD